MYCRNCGNKIEEEDIFCTSCGNKVTYEKPHPLIDLKNMPKNTKKVFFSLILLLALVFIGKNIYGNYLSEESFLKRYIKAYVNEDYEKIIKLSGIENNEFINTKNIKEKYNEKKHKKVTIKNITDNSNKKKEYNRTITYFVDGSQNNDTITLKKKGKKYLIFNDYIVTSNDFLAKNISFTVPKNAVLKVDNVVLDEKYIEKKEENTTTYKIEELLRKNVKINIELENKITIYDTRSVFTNEELDYTELNYNIAEQNKNMVEEKAREAISTFINYSLQNKELEELKNIKIFREELVANIIFIENYNKIKEKYQGQVNKFKIENIQIENVKINKENEMTLRVKFDYSYDRIEKKNRKNSRVVNLTFNDKLQLEDCYTSNLLFMF